MITQVCPEILIYEDNESTQLVLDKYLSSKLRANLDIRDSYLFQKTTIGTHYIDKFDVIIADYMMPERDATEVLPEMAKCGKTVIFYTAMDCKDFCDRVKSTLGYMPRNFKYVGKATENNLHHICTLIENEVL